MPMNKNKYVYLGTVPINVASEIMAAFDAVVATGFATHYDGGQYVELSISSIFSDKVISMYRFIVNIYEDDEHFNQIFEKISK